MMTIHTLIAASMLCSMSASTVFAQADRTGIEGGPFSTKKAPDTTVVGQTKPSSRDASPTSIRPIERLKPRQAADDAIGSKICIGCGGEPNTTGALSLSATAVIAPVKPVIQLDELRTGTATRKQTDLDTVALASAHREQAASVREKTNGLWQSWLVSVCNGCSDQKPVRSWRHEEWPNRAGPMTTGAVNQKAPPGKPHSSKVVKQTAHHGDLAADLSPENVDSIRRMPRQ